MSGFYVRTYRSREGSQEDRDVIVRRFAWDAACDEHSFAPGMVTFTEKVEGGYHVWTCSAALLDE